MFEFIRTHKKWMQVLLAILILPSFVLFGIDTGNNNAGAADVAVVGKTKITQQEWEDAQRRQLDYSRAVMGERFDPKTLETPEAKQKVLEQLVANRALELEVRNSHMTASDAAVLREVGKMGFAKPDGSLDVEGYKEYLKQRGTSSAAIEQGIRRDLAVQQLAGAVNATGFVPRAVANRLSDIEDQQREVQELMLPVSDFAAQVKVTDEMVKAFYDKNNTLFQIPEQAKIEYVVFDAPVVEKQVSVTDAEVAEYYKANAATLTTPEQRRASHILINAPATASAADKAAAKAKAEALVAELRKNPASFAAVAKAQSQDPSSAEQGGDLGLVEKDALPAPVEAAARKLKQGEISDAVASEFGFHVVTITSLTPSSLKPLEEARPQVAAELTKAKMSKKYSELVEIFTNTVEDQFSSLKPVADKLGLKIETAEGVTRTGSPALGTSPVNNPKFLAALFADDALKAKRNTRAVELGGSALVAGRVVDYKPASKRPLAEVAAAIRPLVEQEEAFKLARKAGQAKLAAAKAAKDAAGFGEVKVISRGAPTTTPRVAAEAIMKADVTALPAYIGVDLPGMGYAVYRIGKVSQPAAADPQRRAQAAEYIGNVVAQQETFAYVEALKAKAKSRVLVKPAVADAAK